MDIVPSLAGLCSGLAGTHSQRLKKLDKLFDHKSDHKTEDLNQLEWKPQQLNKLFNDVKIILH